MTKPAKKPEQIHTGLCFRCEHRAVFLKTGRRPRWECGEINREVSTCYMYIPGKPIVLEPSDPDDPRPRFGPAAIASREHALRTLERDLDGLCLDIIWSDEAKVAFGWTCKKPFIQPRNASRKANR